MAARQKALALPHNSTAMNAVRVKYNAGSCGSAHAVVVVGEAGRLYVLFHCAEQFGRQGITGFTGVIANLVYGVEFAIVSHVLADQGPYQMVGPGT